MHAYSKPGAWRCPRTRPRPRTYKHAHANITSLTYDPTVPLPDTPLVPMASTAPSSRTAMHDTLTASSMEIVFCTEG
mgnify:CR=1 FL=1